MNKVSFQGEHGAYSESAAKKFFGKEIDAITNTNLHVIGEEYFKVEHCLIGTGKLEDIETVYSHPQALGPVSYTHLTLPTNREV